MEIAAKKRDAYWDNYKGILIILVVFAHCLYGLMNKQINSAMVQYIYFFHMPAFVFVSGFFSKSENARSRESIVKLIVSYFLIMMPFMIRAFLNGKTISFLTPSHSGWYLLALIAWRLITPRIAHHKHILLIVTVTSILIGFFESINGCQVFAINKIVTFFPYFLLGYLTSEDLVNDKFRKRVCQKELYMEQLVS